MQFDPWIRKWQPTPVFLPGEAHGQGSLVGCRPWCQKVKYDWVTQHAWCTRHDARYGGAKMSEATWARLTVEWANLIQRNSFIHSNQLSWESTASQVSVSVPILTAFPCGERAREGDLGMTPGRSYGFYACTAWIFYNKGMFIYSQGKQVKQEKKNKIGRIAHLYLFVHLSLTTSSVSLVCKPKQQ